MHLTSLSRQMKVTANLLLEALASSQLNQVEKFNIAQALARLVFPQVQEHLDQARRAVIQHLSEKNNQHGQSAIIYPKRCTKRDLVWQNIQITPEVASNPILTGERVPKLLAKQLIKAHRAQVSALTGLLRDQRGKSS